ncbi:alpha/beta hydrolase [Plantactinospora soyae]|uniref:Alpha-beta hydrolase superfamily lysophospholipase n=1 Tax=Plantactinospora soyae TaxID=1544732 RepID=A0A927M4Y7_9ACTN|nr:alpha/beta hydrolase [Plantactinospora soyae]MBE1484555.1 alpha-beta hydrolase superfamily lysophospholipase [Plantactinospora soyae]
MEPDLLGPPYERQTIDLGRDDEGPVLATLVRRRATRDSDRAVLYVHGFVDYFFQTHLADFFVEQGWHFYALDLRKHGRSLLPHQTPNFCADLAEYFPELDAAARIIRETDGIRTLLVNGHSTGGLITPLWAHARRTAGIIDGLFLNSPFFDLNLPWLVRRPMVAALCGLTRLGRRLPYRAIPVGLPDVYGRSLHADHQGEWSYDLGWKPVAGFPIRAGWLAAIRRAQRQLHAGLDIPVPILVSSSSRSFRGRRWHDSATAADAVLDVAQMARWAPKLGRHVTLIRFDGALHDLTLSGPAVRQQVFTELSRWVSAYVVSSDAPESAPASPSSRRHPSAAGATGTDSAPARAPAPARAARPQDAPNGPRPAPAP